MRPKSTSPISLPWARILKGGEAVGVAWRLCHHCVTSALSSAIESEDIISKGRLADPPACSNKRRTGNLSAVVPLAPPPPPFTDVEEPGHQRTCCKTKPWKFLIRSDNILRLALPSGSYLRDLRVNIERQVKEQTIERRSEWPSTHVRILACCELQCTDRSWWSWRCRSNDGRNVCRND